MALKSIGIVGCGAIGQALVKAVESGKLAVRIAGVTSRTEKSAREFLSTFENPPPYLSLHELIAASDLIVEAAGGAVVPRLAEKVFAAGKDLHGHQRRRAARSSGDHAKSRQTGCRLYVPSGAIAGLDGIKSACVGEITPCDEHDAQAAQWTRRRALSRRARYLAGWLARRERGFFRHRARGVPRLSRQRQRFTRP